MKDLLSTSLVITLVVCFSKAMSIDLDNYIKCKPGVQFYNRATDTCIPCRTTCPENQYVIHLCSEETDSECGQIKFGLFQLLSRTSTPNTQTQDALSQSTQSSDGAQNQDDTLFQDGALFQDETLYYIGITLVVSLLLIGLLIIAIAYMCRSYRMCQSKEEQECVYVIDDTDMVSEKELFIENDTLYLIQEQCLPEK